MGEILGREIVSGATIVLAIKEMQGMWPEIEQLAITRYGERGGLIARLQRRKLGYMSKANSLSFLRNEGFDVEKLLGWAEQRFTARGLKATLQTLHAWLAEDICVNYLKKGSCCDEVVCSFNHPKF